MRRLHLVVVGLLLLGTAACPRHVVIQPELVPQYNSADWTIEREPMEAGQSIAEEAPAEAPEVSDHPAEAVLSQDEGS